MGIANEFFPLLIFMGVGAMTDFGPLLANPKTALLGGAAQFGIFGFTCWGLLCWAFDLPEWLSCNYSKFNWVGGLDWGPTIQVLFIWPIRDLGFPGIMVGGGQFGKVAWHYVPLFWVLGFLWLKFSKGLPQVLLGGRLFKLTQKRGRGRGPAHLTGIGGGFQEATKGSIKGV